METLIKQEALDTVHGRVTEKLGKLLDFKTLRPRVCCRCDRLMNHQDSETIPLWLMKRQKGSFSDLQGIPEGRSDIEEALRMYYKCENVDNDCVVSPLSVNGGNNNLEICHECVENSRKSLSICRCPIGKAPSILSELNLVERTLVSQGCVNRHFFNFFGEQHKSMSLFHVMYFMDTEQLVASLQACDLYAIPREITCSLTGPFTKNQRKYVIQQMTVKRERVVAALKWLIENNNLYSHMELPDEKDIPQPVIIDNSTRIDDRGRGLEEEIEKTIVFPQFDKSTEMSSGYANQEEFIQNIIRKKNGGEWEAEVTHGTEQMRLFKDDNLLRAFPVQFPYGTGGRPKGVKLCEYLRYLVGLANEEFQRPEFLLVACNLYVQSIAAEKAILKCKNPTRNGAALDMFNDISAEELEAASALLSKFTSRYPEGEMTEADSKILFEMEKTAPNVRLLLQSTIGIAKDLPHTDEAARSARQLIFSMLAQMGAGAVFFTVNPDDKGNFRVKLYCDNHGTESSSPLEPPAHDADPSVIFRYLESIAQARLSYPGFCCSDFESVIDIVISEIIGWDDTEGKAKENGGIFGIPLAYFMAVEEQGRGSLHAHFILWIKNWAQLLRRLQSQVANDAKQELESYVDTVASNKGFGLSTELGHPLEDQSQSAGTVSGIINRIHGCGNATLDPVEPQILRNLRYFQPATDKVDGDSTRSIVKCSSCGCGFMPEDLKEMVLAAVLDSNWMDGEVDERLQAGLLHEMFHRDRNRGKGHEQEVLKGWLKHFALHQWRNQHDSSHTMTCFKKGCSCRMRQPLMWCPTTFCHMYQEEKTEWLMWNGDSSNMIPFAVEQARVPMDAFSNTYQPHTTELLCCNTNIQVGIGGAHMLYCTCYATKSQRDECSAFLLQAMRGLDRSIRRSIQVEEDKSKSRDKMDEDRPEGDNEEAEESPLQGHGNGEDRNPKEAMRKLLSSVFSATSMKYVISAPMAKYLVSNGSRFRCSHIPVHTPFYDFQDGKSSFCKVNFSKGKTLLHNYRENYTKRPRELESTCVVDFFHHYETATVGGRKREKKGSVMKFLDSHPHHKKLGVVEVPDSHRRLPIVFHTMFGSASNFRGNLFRSEDVSPSELEAMELYSKNVLIAFCPFRDEKELFGDNGYRMKLKEKIDEGVLTMEKMRVLQNMQDAQCSLKSGYLMDPLERCTEEPPDLVERSRKTKEERQKERAEAEEHVNKYLTSILSSLLDEDESKKRDGKHDNKAGEGKGVTIAIGKNTDDVQSDLPGFLAQEGEQVKILQEDEMEADVRMRDNKRTKVDGEMAQEYPLGSIKMCNLLQLKNKISDRFLKEAEDYAPARISQYIMDFVDQDESATGVRKEIGCQLTLLLSRMRNCHVHVANGTVSSIKHWAKEAFGDDIFQQRAFTSMVAEFVLTFLEEAVPGSEGSLPAPKMRARIKHWREGLLELRGMKLHLDKERMVLFLTGPGGSGKSHVIKNVLHYCKSFCLHHKFPFTSRTIVVTALSGVAATSIHGETLHSACFLKVKGRGVLSKLKTNDNYRDWKHARMIIIDEISFGTTVTIESLDKALRLLKQRLAKRYGAMSVIFTGDFSQLEPVGMDALYKRMPGSGFNQWYDWLNLFIELDGCHRFLKDPKYGEIMKRMREGKLTEEDYDLLDTRVVGTPGGPSLSDIPDGVQVATFSNEKRCQCMRSAFLAHLKRTHSNEEPPPQHTIVITAGDCVWKHSRNPLNKEGLELLLQCTDNSVKCRNRFDHSVDPALCLYVGMPLMLLRNSDVQNGLANGTLCKLKEVVLHKGQLSKVTMMTIDGFQVNSIAANHVSYILLEHYDRTCNGEPMLFKLSPEQMQCSVQLPLGVAGMMVDKVEIDIDMTQFPCIANTATTCNKLQGQTRSSLFIEEWGRARNWAYVALSRVTTLAGLFLKSPLPRTRSYKPYGQMVTMLKEFREKHGFGRR